MFLHVAGNAMRKVCTQFGWSCAHHAKYVCVCVCVCVGGVCCHGRADAVGATSAHIYGNHGN